MSDRKVWRKNRIARIEDLKRRIAFNESQIETFRQEIEELEAENAREDDE